MSKVNYISVIMFDAGFRERFWTIDCLNNQTLSKRKYEVIWVEYYNKVHKELSKKKHLKIIKLNRKTKEYHEGIMLNEGIRKSKGDLLVIIDGDLIVEPDFLERIKKAHEVDDNLVLYVVRRNSPYIESLDEKGWETLRTNYKLQFGNCACLTTRKKHIIEVNGYDEHPVFGGLTAISGDIKVRLQNYGLNVQWNSDINIYHSHHKGALQRYEKQQLQEAVVDKRLKNKTIYPYIGLVGL